MKKSKDKPYPHIVWHSVAKVFSGHGTNFWHAATEQFAVAFIDNYGRVDAKGEIHIQIVTRKPKEFKDLPPTAWREIVDEVRAAITAYLDLDHFDPQFRLGRVKVSFGG